MAKRGERDGETARLLKNFGNSNTKIILVVYIRNFLLLNKSIGPYCSVTSTDLHYKNSLQVSGLSKAFYSTCLLVRTF